MRRASVVLILTLIAGCTSGGRPPVIVPTPKPTPTPIPTPTPTPNPPADPVVCTDDSPVEFYVFDNGRPSVWPMNPEKVFWTITPKKHPGAPYGPEGDATRKACELKNAYPVWTNATPRDDSPFAADSARGVHVTVCSRDFPTVCLEADAP